MQCVRPEPQLVSPAPRLLGPSLRPNPDPLLLNRNRRPSPWILSPSLRPLQLNLKLLLSLRLLSPSLHLHRSRPETSPNRLPDYPFPAPR